MYSVTKRSDMTKQPRGGYIKKKDFTITIIEDGEKLNELENISPSLVGLVIDYMTRYLMGTSKEEAFRISLLGAAIAHEKSKAKNILENVQNLDSESIVNACKLAGYDVCYRSGMADYKSVDEINPNPETIDNIVIMIKRSLAFWDSYGPIVKDGFSLEGGYTDIISKGDGDYLTKDTLWDFKVLRNDILPKHSLQLLIYYIMGKHSTNPEFESISSLGIFNPRLNKIYLIDVESISKDTIETVSHDVIGYGMSKEEIQKEIGTSRPRKGKNILQKMNINIDQEFDDSEKKKYGGMSKKSYISKAFPSKVTNKSRYEGTPVFWSGNDIPREVIREHIPYIVRFKARFKIKAGKTPFVKNKLSFLWSPVDELETSDVYDPRTKEYSAFYTDFNGNIVKAKPVLILTSDDFELFNEDYDVWEIEILDGCYFM